MLNPEVLNTSSHWRHRIYMYVQQEKTMDNKFFICENINIFGGPMVGGGTSVIRMSPYLGSHLPSL